MLINPVTGAHVSCVCGSCKTCKHRAQAYRLRVVGPLPVATSEERFWAKVEKTATCWIWTAALQRGYGHAIFNGQSCRAHRVAYELLVGPIPEGLHLDHLCRNRRCVNPAHLEPVTRSVNNARGASKWDRYYFNGACDRGHAWPESRCVSATGRSYCGDCERDYVRTRAARRLAKTA